MPNARIIQLILSRSYLWDHRDSGEQCANVILKVNDPGRASFMNVAELKDIAMSGVVEAQFVVAFLYENGLGCPIDKSEAVRWYQKAAESGFAAAAHSLGR